MALKIQWTKTAAQKFDLIQGYLLEEWGDRFAKAIVRDVYDFLDLAVEHPEIGSCQDKEKGIRAFVIIKQVTLFYRVHKSKIVLLNFFDNRQNPSKKRF